MLRKRLRTTLALLLLAFSANALAHGQAGCRFEYPLSAVCYAEQVLASLGPIELTGGAEVRYREVEFSIAPYVAAAWYASEWFAIVEVRTPFIPEVTPDLGFRFALAVGFRW